MSSLRYPVAPARPLARGRTTMVMPDYPALARAAGDSIHVEIVPGADHMDFLKPSSKAWLAVEAAILRVLRVPVGTPPARGPGTMRERPNDEMQRTRPAQATEPRR